jgi:thiamine-monophosphate kinase
MSGRRIAELGEFELIDLITTGLSSGDQVVLGAGDDAAVLRLRGDLAVSTDTMVENVHFRRDWSSAHDVGRKAVAACVADAEAMGATGVGVVVGLSLPGELEVEWLTEFSAGVRYECDNAGVSLVGGDLTRSSQVVITVTVLDELAGREPLRRSGALPGDLIAFCGRLGWAAAGLAVLSRGFRSPRAVVVAQRVPEPPYGQGAVAAQAGAHALIDVSDGLLADLGHIASASGVQIELDSNCFEIAEPQQAVAAALGGGNPLVYQLTGGEDHALVGSFPPGRIPSGWTVIGRVADGPAQVLLDGVVPDFGAPGWQHFGPVR